MEVWLKNEEAKDIPIEKMFEARRQLQNLINDPIGNKAKALEQIKFLFDGFNNPTGLPKLKLQLFDLLHRNAIGLSRQMAVLIRPCSFRKETKVKRTCCGGKIDDVTIYHCEKKNQPTTEMGCSKCTVAQ